MQFGPFPDVVLEGRPHICQTTARNCEFVGAPWPGHTAADRHHRQLPEEESQLQQQAAPLAMTVPTVAAAAVAMTEAIVLGRVPADLAGGVYGTRREGQEAKQGDAYLPFARFLFRYCFRVLLRIAAQRKAHVYVSQTFFLFHSRPLVCITAALCLADAVGIETAKRGRAARTFACPKHK